jgi:hypothetical protein
MAAGAFFVAPGGSHRHWAWGLVPVQSHRHVSPDGQVSWALDPSGQRMSPANPGLEKSPHTNPPARITRKTIFAVFMNHSWENHRYAMWDSTGIRGPEKGAIPFFREWMVLHKKDGT